MILLAIIFPPLAVLFCGKPVQALLNVFLTILLWVPGVVHALMVVNARAADKRQAALIAAQYEIAEMQAGYAAAVAAEVAANSRPPTIVLSDGAPGTPYAPETLEH